MMDDISAAEMQAHHQFPWCTSFDKLVSRRCHSAPPPSLLRALVAFWDAGVPESSALVAILEVTVQESHREVDGCQARSSHQASSLQDNHI